MAVYGDVDGAVAALRSMRPGPQVTSDWREWYGVVRALTAAGHVDAAARVAEAADEMAKAGRLATGTSEGTSGRGIPPFERREVLKDIEDRRTGGFQQPAVVAGWLVQQGELDRAAAALAKVPETDKPSRGRIEAGLAAAWARRGDRAAAARFARQAEADGDPGPHNLDVVSDRLLLDLSEAHARLGNRADAARFLGLLRRSTDTISASLSRTTCTPASWPSN